MHLLICNPMYGNFGTGKCSQKQKFALWEIKFFRVVGEVDRRGIVGPCSWKYSLSDLLEHSKPLFAKEPEKQTENRFRKKLQTFILNDWTYDIIYIKNKTIKCDFTLFCSRNLQYLVNNRNESICRPLFSRQNTTKKVVYDTAFDLQAVWVCE